jgi:hypothetical protein
VSSKLVAIQSFKKPMVVRTVDTKMPLTVN